MPGSGVFNYWISDRQGKRNITFSVLETDYKSYSVVYSCRMTGDDANDRDLYIQTQSKEPSEESVSMAYKAVSKQGLDTKQLVKLDNTNCDEGSGSDN